MIKREVVDHKQENCFVLKIHIQMNIHFEEQDIKLLRFVQINIPKERKTKKSVKAMK